MPCEQYDPSEYQTHFMVQEESGAPGFQEYLCPLCGRHLMTRTAWPEERVELAAGNPYAAHWHGYYEPPVVVKEDEPDLSLWEEELSDIDLSLG